MVKHNNQIPNQHFKKKWQIKVRTWFNQPGRKVSRRQARQKKAAKVFPRPAAGALRPLVHCPSQRYNMKVRMGRGFTFEELKEAGIPAKFARTIGIAVDHRRVNKCEESLRTNAERLKTYKNSLILFPRKSSKQPAEGETSAKDAGEVKQHRGPIMPPAKKQGKVEYATVTSDMQGQRVYEKLRVERMNAKQAGRRKKRAADAAAEENK